MRNVLLILEREVIVRVRKKSFLLVTLLTPVLFATLMVLPIVLTRMDTSSAERIAVVDYTDTLYSELTESETLSFNRFSDTVGLGAKTLMQDSGYTAVLILPNNFIDEPSNATLLTEKAASLELQGKISRLLERGIEKRRIERFHIEHLDSIMKSVKASVSMRTLTLDKTGEEKESSAAFSAGIGYVLGFIAYMLILISGSMVMNGVIEEKNSRVVEVLVSTVRSFELMMGKILGIASVFLLQILIWIVLTGILVGIAGVVLATYGPGAIDSMSTGAFGVDMAGDAFTEMKSDLLAPLANIPFGTIICASLFFFLFGYLMYAAIYAAVGSAVEEPSDASQMTTPVTLPLVIGLFVLFVAIKNPNGSIPFWFSMIPFTSPVVMPVRAAYGVPTWEIILSGAVLLLSFIGMTWVASRIYRQGILRYGKKYGWRDMWQWLKG